MKEGKIKRVNVKWKTMLHLATSAPLLHLPNTFPRRSYRAVRDTILYRLSLSFCLFLSSSQAEIVKRLSAICAQIIPFLSQEVRVTTH